MNDYAPFKNGLVEAKLWNLGIGIFLK